MPYEVYPWIHLIGRILFALVFVANGFAHLTKSGSMKGYAASKGVPAPQLMVIVTGLVLVTGGLLIAFGWHRFVGAGLLVLFLIPTAFIMHPFWREADPAARAMEHAHFLKDLALAGAALFMAYYGGTWWPMSIGG